MNMSTNWAIAMLTALVFYNVDFFCYSLIE